MTPAPLTESEKHLLRLALSGESVIDGRRLFFSSREDVDKFLKINEYHLEQTRDRDRLMAVHNEAAGYLRGQLRLDLPSELLRPDKIEEIFLNASDFSNRALQAHACSLLKTMNIINHIDGRELLYNAPISARDLYNLVDDKVERELSSLARKELPGIKYEGGRKQKESLITKLLAKRETIAAEINDRVRYRIVTRAKPDIVTVLLRLFDTILPFNYVIPGASVNQLLDKKSILGWKDSVSLAVYRRLKSISEILAHRLPYPTPEEEFTGQNYRVIKFVVDIPVRIDRFLGAAQRVFRTEALGCTAYVLVEFQIVDEETHLSNNSGENAHDRYKRRQKSGVIRRLMGAP